MKEKIQLAILGLAILACIWIQWIWNGNVYMSGIDHLLDAWARFCLLAQLFTRHP